MNDEQHLRPHRGQAPAKGFDPELFRQFIENQAQELEIRSEENEIKRQELELGYKHAAVVLAAQVDDRQRERQHDQKTNLRGSIIVCFLFVVLIAAILYALRLDKDLIVLELLKYVGLILAGGVSGYSMRTIQERKETAKPPPKSPA